MLAKILVTGVHGCIGAWVARELLQSGHTVVGADLAKTSGRLELVLGTAKPADEERLTLVQLDVRDGGAVQQTLESGEFDSVIHLAALQIPFCKATPILGAQVNVIGVLNFLEMARKLSFRFVYASSTAVYGPSVGQPLLEDENLLPSTLYGVFKRTDEEMARVYASDYAVSSACLRPWIVYGPARDQGLTADLTLALFHAARGEPYRIRFRGNVVAAHAQEVAQAFVTAALNDRPGARVYTLGGRLVDVEEVVDVVHKLTGQRALLTVDDSLLPIASETTDAAFQADFGPFKYQPIESGFDATLSVWRERGLIPAYA